MTGATGAVVLGNGPSLNQIDVPRLAGLLTVALNRSFVAWDRWGFTPRWYACTDPMTAKALAADMGEVLAHDGLERLFLHAALADALPADPRIVFVRPAARPFGFLPDPNGRGGAAADYGNVGANALQYLHAHGVRRVLLVGTDASYRPHDGTNDPNHFTAGYLPSRPYRRTTPSTEGWTAAVADAEAAGMTLRLRARGSALEALAGLRQDAAPFAETLAWVRDGDG